MEDVARAKATTESKMDVGQSAAKIPLDAILRILLEAFSSAVQQPLSTRRGKGANAHWGVVVKSHGAPPSDIINLGGSGVGVRAGGVGKFCRQMFQASNAMPQ